MKQLKVKKKDILVLNVVIYLVLSFIFLCLQYAYRHHISPLSWEYLKKSIELFWYVTFPVGVAITLVWGHHRHSTTAFNFCMLLIGFKVTEGLFIEFNKIIVIALFFFSVISYFLYQLLKSYLSSASLNSNYRSSDLFNPLLKTIPCTITSKDSSFTGTLTNWDEEGCFIKLDEKMKSLKKIEMQIFFEGREFTHQGEVVAQSRDLTGIGIKFQKKAKDLKTFNWAEFTELVQELGFRPERLR